MVSVMKTLKAWITKHINPELLEPRHAAGMVLIIAGFIVFFAVYGSHGSDAGYIVSAALYAVGMILIIR